MMQNLSRKNPLQDYGAEPSYLVWEKIEKRLPPPRNRKRLWLAWSAAAILVGGLFLSAYFFDIKITLKKKEIVEKTPSHPANKTNAVANKISSVKNQGQVTEQAEKKDSDTENEKTSEKNLALTQTNRNVTTGKNKISLAAKETVTAAEKTKEETEAAPAETVIAMNRSMTVEKTSIEKVNSIGISGIPFSIDSLQTLQAAFIDFQPVKKNYSVSRWQLSATGGQNYSYRTLNFSSAGNTALSEEQKNYLSENEQGIRTPAFETDIGYSISTHFSLSFGINYFTAGQERTQSEIILTSNVTGTGGTQYSVNTSVGTLSANGSQVDYAVFSKNDTSLFTANAPLTGAPVHGDSSTVRYFKLRQEFSFISFPMVVQYQPAEHRFTPFFGLGLSAGHIFRERVIINGTELTYSYLQGITDIIFFAEAQAGVKYRINNHLYFKVQPSLRYGLNSLSGDENIKWIPYSAGVGAGINLKF